jgi:hypothetical protein
MSIRFPLHMGLEPLAVALILAPEPATTVIGIGLLAYSRTQRYLQGKEQEKARLRAHPLPSYTHKMKLVRGETIVYQTCTKHAGQLPAVSPAGKGLYYDPCLWQSYYQHVQKRVAREKALFAASQKAAAAPVSMPAAISSPFKRPASMPARVSSYRLPPRYRPQPAMAAAPA